MLHIKQSVTIQLDQLCFALQMAWDHIKTSRDVYHTSDEYR